MYHSNFLQMVKFLKPVVQEEKLIIIASNEENDLALCGDIIRLENYKHSDEKKR